eukprot:scpid81049/ scgid20052/ 
MKVKLNFTARLLCAFLVAWAHRCEWATAAPVGAAPPTYVGFMYIQGGGGDSQGLTLNSLTVGDHWSWEQHSACSYPNASIAMFGSHQASYAPRRRLMYKGIMFGDDQHILRISIAQGTWELDCTVLPTKLPIPAGEYRMDIFPDQDPKEPKPTIVGALNGSPTTEYHLYELHGEDSDKPELKSLMVVKLKHQVQQVFGSYYDSTSQVEYIGFNEGHLFWDVEPCWILIVDVGNKKVLNATYYEHESGYDIWWDPTLKSFFIPTMDDCAVNKTSCIQGVRPWTAAGGLGEVQRNMCIGGTACFSFEVGYGYAFNPSNHTAVLYGGVSGWWWYDVTNAASDQYEYDTVFVNNPVYIGDQSSRE